MKKILYIISDIDKALAFEWLAKNLDADHFQLSFILLNTGNSDLEDFLRHHDTPVHRITPGKGWRLGITFISLLTSIASQRPQVIHTHLRIATLLGITAGWLLRVPKRIYTRHSSTYNRQYHPHAVKYDRFINRLATQVVAISEVVRQVLIRDEKVPPGKVALIHHGFDLSYFNAVPPEAVDKLSSRYNPTGRKPVIGVISRYIHLKGHQYIIQAFAKLLEKYPNALLILANANGSEKQKIREQLHSLPQDSFIEIPFEKNLNALYRIFDVYIHAPIDPQIEAFGQTYIEALAAGVPSVFTISGVAAEFIRPKENAYVAPYKDANAIYEGLMWILENPDKAAIMAEKGKESIQQFNLVRQIKLLEDLYS